MREEERLAATLWQIEEDASIVPRGAYILHSNGDVEGNRRFEGLTVAESGKLYNYYHFREPFLSQQNNPPQRFVLDRSLHFFDTINDDIPKGLNRT